MAQAVPDWVSFEAEKTEGLDLLGLRAPVQRIGNDLFDGITTVSKRPANPAHRAATADEKLAH